MRYASSLELRGVVGADTRDKKVIFVEGNSNVNAERAQLGDQLIRKALRVYKK